MDLRMNQHFGGLSRFVEEISKDLNISMCNIKLSHRVGDV